ncbi:hypothetical protein OAA48_00620 [bacterium]|nr:hypothetical protein [bacterium]
MKNNDPIDLFIVCCLLMADALLWLVNELAGHHKPVIKVAPMVQPLFSEVQALTVKQLRQLTGVKSTKIRKPELIEVYCSC